MPNEQIPPLWEVVAEIFNGCVIPVFSEEILKEYAEVLHRDKFGFSASTVDVFLGELRQRGILLETGLTGIVLPDMNDVPFYAVTLTNGEDNTYLVTGNFKHFPVKPFIVTPARFLEILKKAD